jgi:hypothetical protein
LGIFSVFNPELIKDVSIVKSGIPAQYGGKLSSVIKLNSYKGNKDSLDIMGSVGLISSRIAVGGPLFSKNGTFIVGARRTYLQLTVRPILKYSATNTSFLSKDNIYNFYDFNAGATLKISNKNTVSFSGYYGRDNYRIGQPGIKQQNQVEWGNRMASIHWNRRINFNDNLNTSISWTKYDFNLTGSQAEYYFGLYSSVEDYNIKSELSLNRKKNQIITGFEVTEHGFVPNRIKAEAGKFNLNFAQFGSLHALEGGVFINDEYQFSDKISLTAGLRLSFFNHHGPYIDYTRNSLNQITDTINYGAGKSLAFYSNAEPRVVLKYQINTSSSVKASYMRMAQYLHLATSSSSALPADIWIPSTSEIKPLLGDQVSLGYFKNFSKGDIEFSAETYYKQMNNQLEFLRGIVNISIDGNMVKNLAMGFGQAYGVELYLAKKKGFSTGWISYTLSRTELKFDKINEGMIYPAKYDRRHDLSLAFMRQFNANWSGSAVFIYISGNAFTMPVGRYIIQGSVVNQYGKVNSFRMPANHRMDISFTRKLPARKNRLSELAFSVYNVYNRANPYFIYYEVVGNVEKYSLMVKAFKVSLIPIIPSLSWNFKF